MLGTLIRVAVGAGMLLMPAVRLWGFVLSGGLYSSSCLLLDSGAAWAVAVAVAPLALTAMGFTAESLANKMISAAAAAIYNRVGFAPGSLLATMQSAGVGVSKIIVCVDGEPVAILLQPRN